MIASSSRFGWPRSYMSQMNGNAITDGSAATHQALGPGTADSRSDSFAAAHQLATFTRPMQKIEKARPNRLKGCASATAANGG